jgi:hypothetical protein
MFTHALPRPANRHLARWLVVGFLAGAASVVVFHQGLGELLHATGETSREFYSFAPTKPLGVPQLASLAFWGGLWGIALAAAFARTRGLGALPIGALVFGAVLPTLVAWFVVAPLKGTPLAAGGAPGAMLLGVVLNGAWGLGTGIGLALFARERTRSPA